ncbi:MAG: hypothetical protein OQJ84_04510 [Xanthomonadales bacterium]|nr:hypothetical protein [Xanthomonadales bacterium]
MMTFPASAARMEQGKYLLFFCPEKVAFIQVSGIITTNLGKTATPIKIAGREKTDTSLQNMPFSQTGEGHFLWSTKFNKTTIKNVYIHIFKTFHLDLKATVWCTYKQNGYNIAQG